MADEADRAQVAEELFLQSALRGATAPAFIPGEPGECERCGDDMPRLVGGLCAPCRDGRNRFARRSL